MSEETRQSERVFLEQHEVYRQILDAIADMVLVKGAGSRILWANKAFRDYYGMSNDELRDLVDAPFNAPDNTLRYVQDDARVYNTGDVLHIPEEPVTRHDGLVQLFDTVKSPLRDGEGRVRMTVGVSRNITEQKRTQQDLARYRDELERDRLAAFAAQLPGFLFQYRIRPDGTHHVPFASTDVRAYYDASPADIAVDAATMFARVVPEDRAELEKAFRDSAESLSGFQSAHRVVLAGGETRWMELIARPNRERDGGLLWYGYAHDVTQRKTVEAERERLIAELRAKNAEMEQFTYTISHDLKSPLVTIRGFLGMIAEDVRRGNSERALADLERVRAASERMSQMLAELLDLSRVGRIGHSPVPVKLTAVVSDALGAVAGRIDERGVAVHVASELPEVFGDRARLVQVFQNLLENAVKYMGAQATPMIHVEAAPDRGGLTCVVRDNGLGIPAGYEERIFGLFEKLDPKAEGTGVGLALVRRIVEFHGGRVWAESEGPGRGASFFVQLPVRAPE